MSKIRRVTKRDPDTIDSFLSLESHDATPNKPSQATAMVSIELPIGEFSERQNRPGHIEARLSPKQGRALQRLLNGLNAEHGQGWASKDISFADVLRWLLDQLPD